MSTSRSKLTDIIETLTQKPVEGLQTIISLVEEEGMILIKELHYTFNSLVVVCSKGEKDISIEICRNLNNCWTLSCIISEPASY